MQRPAGLPGSRAGGRYAPPDRSAAPQEATIASEPAAPRAGTSLVPAAVTGWLEAWQPEDAALVAARQRAAEVGVGAVDPATGAVLRLLAATTRGRHVVELGTGVGVSSLYLLSGMQPDGVLTSVDSESEHQRLAKQALADAGVPSGRARLISGRALEVVPRLSDGGYDLVFCDAAKAENLDYLEGAVRLLRPGGVVVFAGALAGGKVADSAARDDGTVGLRDLAKAVRDHEQLVPAVLPVGTGLLVAARL